MLNCEKKGLYNCKYLFDSLILKKNIMKFRFILYIILSCLFLSASADNLTTAKQLYSEGKYSEALPLFMEQYKKNPKNGSINHWIGVCLYYEERYSESEKYFKYAETRKVNDAT